MTVFEQQNLKDLRRLGFVQISNPEAARNLHAFVQANFAQEFPNGLKLLIGVGQYGTDNYIVHAVLSLIKAFTNDIQTRMQYHLGNAERLRTALNSITG